MIDLDRYAERILTTAHVDDAEPVSVRAVCAALGYVVYTIHPPNPRLVGLMLFDDVARYGERRLYVAAATPEAFRVRTVHLLGHALLHSAPPPPHSAGFKDTGRTVTLTTVLADTREAEANAFAASLLMPRRWVVQQCAPAGGCTRWRTPSGSPWTRRPNGCGPWGWWRPRARHGVSRAERPLGARRAANGSLDLRDAGGALRGCECLLRRCASLAPP